MDTTTFIYYISISHSPDMLPYKWDLSHLESNKEIVIWVVSLAVFICVWFDIIEFFIGLCLTCRCSKRKIKQIPKSEDTKYRYQHENDSFTNVPGQASEQSDEPNAFDYEINDLRDRSKFPKA